MSEVGSADLKSRTLVTGKRIGAGTGELPASLPGLYMSRVMRKPVFRVSNQVRHKPGWIATEDG